MFRQFVNKYNPKRVRTNKRLLAAQALSEKPTSVIFFTTHKCASSFMGDFFMLVAENSNYKVVDYASSIWALGDSMNVGAAYEPFLEQNYDRLYFNNGEIYAPQRRPIFFPGIERFKHIFFLRDPRDVLVSAFYSFSLSHAPPENTLAKDEFLKERVKIQQGTIDDYVKEAAKDWVLPLYKDYQHLREGADSSIFLSYDFFNSNLPGFIKEVSSFLNFDSDIGKVQKIVKENNRDKLNEEDVSKHRRSGKSGQFREKLLPETVSYINDLLRDVLTYWDFERC